MTKFAKLVRKLKRRGVRSPKGLAAYIGRRRYGKKRFQAMAAAGRRRKRRAKIHRMSSYRLGRRAVANPHLVDPDWQEHAISNAKKGYPWATWGSRDGRPLHLLGSHKTKVEAERYADSERRELRPKGSYTIIVTNEAQNPYRRKRRRNCCI